MVKLETRMQRWYRSMKERFGKNFLKHRAMLQRRTVKKRGQAHKAYMKKYAKEYWKRNRKKLNKKYREYRQKNPDKNRNARVAKCIAWQKEALTDAYIRRISRQRNLSAAQIAKKRQDIIAFRKRKQSINSLKHF